MVFYQCATKPEITEEVLFQYALGVEASKTGMSDREREGLSPELTAQMPRHIVECRKCRLIYGLFSDGVDEVRKIHTQAR